MSKGNAQQYYNSNKKDRAVSSLTQGLLLKASIFAHGVKDMEQKSWAGGDFYTEDTNKEYSNKLSNLARRHTRHLIPSRHSIAKNGKPFVEVLDCSSTDKYPTTALCRIVPSKR